MPIDKEPTKPKIIDQRGKLPVHATKKWGRRKASDIKGIVVHQSAGSKKWLTKAIAEYHVGPNHISDTGAPGLCYTYAIEPDGKIIQANDIEDVTWSQATSKPPIPGTMANTHFLGICVLGDFDGPSHDGQDNGPTAEQLKSLEQLVAWLQKELSIPQTGLYGHYHFGKENCPGKELADFVENTRARGLETLLPVEVADWQSLLVKLGYDLGRSGPKHDGVDGDWGTRSKVAITAFQAKVPVPITGYCDRLTAVALAAAVQAITPLTQPIPGPTPTVPTVK